MRNQKIRKNRPRKRGGTRSRGFTPEPVLELREAGLFRREKFIFRDLDWRVDAEQHWVILGPNGSGKSTLLAAIYGYEILSQGTMRVGKVFYGEGDWKKIREK